MPAVFVHGVPDTGSLWGRLRAHLARRDVVVPELIMFEGCSHWWPWERARESAVALEHLWSTAPSAERHR